MNDHQALFDYPIRIGHQIFDELLEEIIKIKGKKLILTDSNVSDLYLDQLKAFLELSDTYLLSVTPGEGSKSLSTYQEVMTCLTNYAFDRGDSLIAFGGGVIGDLGGFVAATYLRGIRLIQVPTTLLAMVDSSVGSKNGINFSSYKNQLGTFYAPTFVHIDTAYLETLDSRQRNNGLAEVIKYGILKSPDLLEELKKAEEEWNYPQIIHQSLATKQAYVQGDLHDKGQRQFLNLGHTFGHALESVSHNQLNHGEAVAIGMMWMAKASHQLGYTEQALDKILTPLYDRLGLAKNCYYDNQAILQAVCHDKKVLDREISLIIPVELGKCVRCQIPMADLIKWLEAGQEVESC